jgi:hypothetical protein
MSEAACVHGRDLSVLARSGSLSVPAKTFVQGVKSGRKPRTVAKDGTRDCWQVFHRVFDLQPRGHFGRVVSYPARRRSALATRFRQCAAQRPFPSQSSSKSRRAVKWKQSPRCAVVISAPKLGSTCGDGTGDQSGPQRGFEAHGTVDLVIQASKPSGEVSIRGAIQPALVAMPRTSSRG